MEASNRQRRRCTATSKQSGQPCRRWAILGGTVCATHGGRAPQVRRKAAERLADLVDPDRILRQAAYLAYSDIRQLLDEQGRLKPSREWPDAIAAAVSTIKVTKRNLTAGDGEQEDVVEVKLWDKPRNLEMLFKHKGLFVERHEVNVTADEAVLEALAAGRQRIAAARRGTLRAASRGRNDDNASGGDRS